MIIHDTIPHITIFKANEINQNNDLLYDCWPDRRIGKKVNGALVQGFFYQDQINPVAKLDGSGNVVAQVCLCNWG